MARVVLAIAVLAAALSSLVRWPSGDLAVAHACSIGSDPLERMIELADVIVLADIAAVGGAANSLPRLTPSATLTPTPWWTGTASPTVDRSATATDTPAPRPTPTPYDFTGIGATAQIVRAYKGVVGSPVELDSEIRLSVERDVRYVESLPPPLIAPCQPGLATIRYTPGARYVIAATLNWAGGIETVTFARWRVIGDEVVLQDESMPASDSGLLVMSRAMYERYFSGIPAEGEEHVVLRAQRVPLETFERAILGLPPITPPVTGSAGLKAVR